MRRAACGLALLAMLGAGPLPSEAAGCAGLDATYHRLGTERAEIAYRWEPAEVKVGRFFAAEVIACRAPGRAAVNEIAIEAVMPAHGHGMNYRPAVEFVSAGHFRVTGLMLHMPGQWQFRFDLYQGALRTRLIHDLVLKP